MANRSIEQPLIVIVGPTASGKTSLALDVAERYNGEIIATDSRTVYRGLDIGTAKPSPEEQAKVRHHGLDLIDPSEVYSATQFQRYARDRIKNIRSRDRMPLLVGGTGLYVNSVMYNYSFADIDANLRDTLEPKSVNELYNYCSDHNIPIPADGMSKSHLINYIVRGGKQQQSEKQLENNTYVIGIATEKTELRSRIHARAVAMFDSDIIIETLKAADKYGWDAPGLSGNIYKIIRQLENGELRREEAIESCSTRDWQLAKRQLTWFRRDPNICWLQLSEAEHYITGILASEH